MTFKSTTTILGYTDSRTGIQYIAGDSQATADIEYFILEDPKIYNIHGMLIGGTGNLIATAQFLRVLSYTNNTKVKNQIALANNCKDVKEVLRIFDMEILPTISMSLEAYILQFIGDKTTVPHAAFLIGLGGIWLDVDVDFAFTRSNDFAAKGSGSVAAHSVYKYIENNKIEKDPIELIKEIMQVVFARDSGCRPPIHIKNTLGDYIILDGEGNTLSSKKEEIIYGGLTKGTNRRKSKKTVLDAKKQK